MPRETGKERPACTMAAAEGAVPAHRDASLSRHRKARPAQSARIGAGDDRTRASRLTERRLRMKNSPMTKAANLGHRRGLLLRLLVSGMVLALWFWTQSLIGARTAPASGIGDALQNLTAGLNSYFAQNTRAADRLLIVSSALIDALGLFLLGRWLFGGRVRPPYRTHLATPRSFALPKKLELFSGCGGGCGMGEGRCRQVHRCHIHREQDDSCNSLGSRRSDQGQHQTDRHQGRFLRIWKPLRSACRRKNGLSRFASAGA